MRTSFIALLLLAASAMQVQAQDYTLQTSANGFGEDSQYSTSNQNKNRNDSTKSNKEIPIGIKVWTVDELFGDRTEAQLDTMPHMYPNTIFTTGLRGEYNTLGNLGSPRQSRIFMDREDEEDFIFTLPYDFFIHAPSDFHFTNTLSPFTNLSYNNAGNRINGEDHFTAKFGVNAGKKIGLGFNFDYIYGRGYYSSQATSHSNYTGYGSYIGDRYQAHLLFSTNHQKVTENGGISNDKLITHPESFDDDLSTTELPTVLEENWNRNDNQHLFFTQRYSLGFHRKVKMTEEEIKARKFAMESQKENAARKAREERDKRLGRTDDETTDREEEQPAFKGRPDDAAVAGYEPADSVKAGGRIAVNGAARADSLIAAETKAKQDTAWLKTEYVPVTSFIHTLQFDNYRRIYQAYQTPDDFYANTYDVDEPLTGDSIYDKTKHYSLRNTFAISLLEGFNKWAKAGLKGFVSHEMKHFELPDTVGVRKYNENTLWVGGQISKTQGKLLHFNALAQFGIVGEKSGCMKLDGNLDVNIPLFGDTLQIAGNAFIHRVKTPFYFSTYYSKHFAWDSEQDNYLHSRIGGSLSYPKTGTTLRFAVDELKDYAYLGMSYTQTYDEDNQIYNWTNVDVKPLQSDEAITVLTAQVEQNFQFGPFGWESVVTWQKSTKQDVLPLPSLNIYTNLFLKFKIARVLKCELGADLRYFTKYNAPEYSPALGYFAVQLNDEKVETGNYPLVNAYLNFHLKHTRFFVMFSHVNAGSGNKNYFLTPHYPLNERIFRIGVSWNFFN